MTFVRIPFIGGPLDGEERDHQIQPADKAELTHDGHSYEFCLAEWSWLYKQRWRHVEHAGQLITFRTYSELCRKLGYLQVSGCWTVYDSLAVQTKVRSSMGDDIWKFKPIYNEANNDKPSI